MLEQIVCREKVVLDRVIIFNRKDGGAFLNCCGIEQNNAAAFGCINFVYDNQRRRSVIALSALMRTFPSEATVKVFEEAARALSAFAFSAPTLMDPATVVPAASNKAEPLTSES